MGKKKKDNEEPGIPKVGLVDNSAILNKFKQLEARIEYLEPPTILSLQEAIAKCDATGLYPAVEMNWKKAVMSEICIITNRITKIESTTRTNEERCKRMEDWARSGLLDERTTKAVNQVQKDTTHSEKELGKLRSGMEKLTEKFKMLDETVQILSSEKVNELQSQTEG